MIKIYYMLAKPGIIFGNIITTAAGFMLASKGTFDYLLFLYTLIGLTFVVASAGVFNNYIDRKADQKMARTKNRGLATGKASTSLSLVYGTVLGITGLGILGILVNPLSFLLALIGLFFYLVVYTFWKYRSFYGTLVGSIAGAMPPVIGYCAVSNKLDLTAAILFIILVLWQMPHFYSIAVYRLEDYTNAGIPVLPAVKGLYATKVEIVLYILAFIGSLFALGAFHSMNNLYYFSSGLLGLFWLILSFKGFQAKNNKTWAYQMFALSLVVIMGVCFAISLNEIVVL